MEQMTGNPWPGHGQANRNQEPRDTGIYGRFGADHLGRKIHNSYRFPKDNEKIRVTYIEVYIHTYHYL